MNATEARRRRLRRERQETLLGLAALTTGLLIALAPIVAAILVYWPPK
jgi:hypothetical protein